MKYNVYSAVEKGLIPSIGFQIRWRIPKIGEDYRVDYLAPRFLFATNQQLSERLTFTTNWGATWNGIDAMPQGNYTINLAFTISDKFGAFIENYGNLLKSDFDTFLDGGFAFLINNNFQIDILSGYGSNENVKDFFVSAGVSWRTANN